MLHKKKYATLASLLILGGTGLVTYESFDSGTLALAEVGEVEDVTDFTPATSDEDSSPIEVLDFYNKTGTMLRYDDSMKDSNGNVIHRYSMGSNFSGAIKLTEELRPKFSENMTYSLVYKGVDGKGKEVLVDNKPYVENQIIQTFDKKDGVYAINITGVNPENTKEKLLFEINIQEFKGAEINLNISEKNPESVDLVVKSKDVDQIDYAIISSDGVFEKTGQLDLDKMAFPKDLFDDLANGKYTFEITVTSIDEDTDNVMTTVETKDFTIDKSTTIDLNPTITVDSEINPINAMVNQSTAESTFTYVVKNKDGKEQFKGDGIALNIVEFAKLSDGEYTIVFTEKAVDNTTKDVSKKIVRKNPKASIKLTSETDPDSIALDSSGVENNTYAWEIKNGADVIAMDSKTSVHNSILQTITEGDYSITFTETDAYGVVSTDTKEFKVLGLGGAGVGDNNQIIEVIGEDGDITETIVSGDTINSVEKPDADAEGNTGNSEQDTENSDKTNSEESKEDSSSNASTESDSEREPKDVTNNTDKLKQTDIFSIRNLGIVLLAVGSGIMAFLFLKKKKEPKVDVPETENKETDKNIDDTNK